MNKKKIIFSLITFGITFIFIIKYLSAEKYLNNKQGSKNEISLLKNINIKPLNFEIPKTIISKLQNNITLFKLSNNESPFVSLKLYFRNGQQNESIEKAAYLKALIELLEKGGTKKYEGAKLSEKLTELDMVLDVDVGEQFWSIEIKLPKNNFDDGLTLLEELLEHPALPENYLKNIQNNLILEIKQSNEKGESIAQKYLAELLFPKQRKGYSLKNSDIEKLNISNLKKELAWRTFPEGMYITFTGDITHIDIESKLTNLINILSKNSIKNPKQYKDETSQTKFSILNNIYRDKIILINKNLPQAIVRMGNYLPPHNSKEFFSLQVGNNILGMGGFNSRLMQKIRNKEGLAYYAFSTNIFEAEYGLFIAGCGTRSEFLDKTLNMMLFEISNMKNGVTIDEIKLAKDSIVNGYVFQFDNVFKITSEIIRFKFHNMPENYLEIFPKKIVNVKEDEIIKNSNFLENPFIIVVGSKNLEEKLSKIRPVIIKELNEPLF